MHDRENDITMPYTEEIKHLLAETLQIQDRIDTFNQDTLLVGHVPELDSMAVVSVINALEQEFNITIEDEEINMETFESIGTLATFIREKCQTH
jgi:acyl carrier protein